MEGLTEDRERVLDKLKKMYRHAKSAEAIGSEAEAQAFAAKVQELLSRHKIDMSEVEYQKLDETDPILWRYVDFDSANVPIRTRRVEWQENIADVVCQAYFCKLVLASKGSGLHFVGRGSDAEAAEQVFLYLIRVASNLADKAYVRFFFEARAAGNVRLARGFRASYLRGFAGRLTERFSEERERMRQEAAASQLALVRLTDALEQARDHVAYSGRTKPSSVLGNPFKEENEPGFQRGRRDAGDLPIGKDKKQVEK